MCTPVRSRFAVPSLCRGAYDAEKHKFASSIACTAVEASNSDSDAEVDSFVALAMPVFVRHVGYNPKHRTKIPEMFLPFVALVARLV